MNKVNLIWHHLLYQFHYQNLQVSEYQYIFVNHTLEHFLDVARIAWILNLEEHAGMDKEIIYATDLLYDIGRYEQLHSGRPHNEIGAELSRKILFDCEFIDADIDVITWTIYQHRTKTENESLLSFYIYKADKMLRNCFNCEVESECNWESEKKNRIICR